MKQKKSEKDYIAYEGYSDRRKIQKIIDKLCNLC